MSNPYARIFREPGANGFSAAAFLGRLPMAMAPIGLVAMLAETLGEYSLAGAVAASFTLTNAFFAPQISRLVDRFGQTRVAAPATLVCVIAFLLLVLAVRERWPTWTLFAAAAPPGTKWPRSQAMSRSGALGSM